MSILEDVKEALTGPKGRPDDGSKGAFWCDDCNVRLRDVEVEADPDADEALSCPECDAEMRFERASGRGCAC